MPNKGTKIFTDTLKYFPATFKFTAKTTEVYLKQSVSDTLYIIQYSPNTLSFLSYGDVTKNSVEQIAHLLNLSLKQPRLPIIPLPQFLPPTMYITPAEQPTPPPRVQPVAPPRVHKQKNFHPHSSIHSTNHQSYHNWYIIASFVPHVTAGQFFTSNVQQIVSQHRFTVPCAFQNYNKHRRKEILYTLLVGDNSVTWWA